MRKSILALSFLAASTAAIAQPEGRVFTIYNQNYTSLSAPTVITTQGWDDFDATVPLGFNFTMMGKTTDKLVFDANFNSGADAAFDTLANGKTHMIAFTTDLVDRSTISGNTPSVVSYKTDVANNKKITKVEWKNVGFWGENSASGTLNDSASFQLWLYEGTNDVEVHWGPFSINSDYWDIFDTGMPTFGFVKNIDFNGQSIDYFYYVSATGTPKVDSVDMAGLMGGANIGFPTYPANGTVFKFSKAVTSVDGGVKLNDYTKVYPTAVNDVCHVELNLSQVSGNISLIDMSGKVVLTQKAENGRNDLFMQNLPAGMYTLNVNNAGQSVFYKITKL